tara:strand:- start:1161 stop:1859 length:699 start_codon:yes stop_codon:yes gene_type:complete
MEIESERTKKIHTNLDQDALKVGIGGKFSPETNEETYKLRMQKRKEIQLERLKIRKNKKGLVIVFTGSGKGKTTAALGMALRTLGHMKKVVIIQFIKGSWETGEEKALRSFSNYIKWHSLGEGFTWETQDRIKDEKLVKEAWNLAKEYIKNKSYKLVILDEINIAIKLGYIKSEEIIDFIKRLENKNNNHIVLTGRGAPDSLIKFADLVTEMNLIKHPFKDQGIKAQKCIEF